VICLDTNAVSVAINLREPRVRAKLEQALRNGIAVGIPAIVLFELWHGISKSAQRAANVKRLAAFLALGLEQWPFDDKDAQDAGEIRASLERAGTSIGPYDVLIAAQARRRGALLVTANAREFARVPGLKCEDWSLDA
jgi:tRNA(fMet)-specific endonuclease VapC